jgi:aspartate-semialdehyde dehydrogenase
LAAPIQLHTCFAPVLRGGAFFVQATLQNTPHTNGIRSLFQEKSFCQLLDSGQPIGTHDLLAEDKLYIQNIEINKNTVSFWLIQDPLQTGFIQNAVQILSLLIK